MSIAQLGKHANLISYNDAYGSYNIEIDWEGILDTYLGHDYDELY